MGKTGVFVTAAYTAVATVHSMCFSCVPNKRKQIPDLTLNFQELRASWTSRAGGQAEKCRPHLRAPAWALS